MLRDVGSGVKDALSFHKIAVFYVHESKSIGPNTAKCFTLNGLFFLGGLLVFNYMVMPAIQFFGRFLDTHAPKAAASDLDINVSGALSGEITNSIAYNLNLIFWVIPIFLLSTILNNIWYMEIAEQAYAMLEKIDAAKKEADAAKKPSKPWGVGRGVGEVRLLAHLFNSSNL